jgi:outer membrane biosynthesis protein TonB
MPVLRRLKETDVSIQRMDSPRSGFRRAAAASWALAGIGVAGVAGASTLAYADTFKPAAEAPAEEAITTAPEDLGPPPAVDVPVPEVVPTTLEPPPAPALPPVTTEAPVQKYTPSQTYQQAPSPITNQAPAPTRVTTAPTTTHHVNTPTTVKSPNYSPHVTLSRGS